MISPPTFDPAGAHERGERRIRWRPTGQWAMFLGLAFVGISAFTGGGAQLGLGLTMVVLCLVDRWIVSRALEEVVLDAALPPVSVAYEDMALLLEVHGARRPVRVELLDPWRGLAGVAGPGDRGVLPVAGPPRGLVAAISAELVVSGPLGLVESSRRVRRWLPTPAAVGPADQPVGVPWPEPTGALVGIDARSPRGQELTRGVREYRHGDPRRRVHWKATAHAGRLMIRETEGEAIGVLTVVLRLSTAGPAAEAAAERARWFAEEGLRRGWVVELVTAEATRPPGADLRPLDELATWQPAMDPGPWVGGDGRWILDPGTTVDRRVSSSVDVLRRLAAAVPGALSTSPRPGVTRIVSDEGDTWR